MCRKNQMLGFALLGFGAGLMIACHVTSVFWCSLFGIGALLVGLTLLQKGKA